MIANIIITETPEYPPNCVRFDEWFYEDIEDAAANIKRRFELDLNAVGQISIIGRLDLTPARIDVHGVNGFIKSLYLFDLSLSSEWSEADRSN